MSSTTRREVAMETQVAAVTTQQDGSQELANLMIDELLQQPPSEPQLPDNFGTEQLKDPKLSSLIKYLEDDCVPSDPKQAQQFVVEAQLFAVLGGILYFIDPKKKNRK